MNAARKMGRELSQTDSQLRRANVFLPNRVICKSSLEHCVGKDSGASPLGVGAEGVQGGCGLFSNHSSLPDLTEDFQWISGETRSDFFFGCTAAS